MDGVIKWKPPCEIYILNLVRFPRYETRQQYFSAVFFLLDIILPSKFWYQNTHKINTEGLWKPKFAFRPLWGSQGMRRANSTYSVF